jgi:lantibiotic transport system permease protein
MLVSFVHSFQSEWLKTKRSAAFWLVLIGSIFIPLILLAASFANFDDLYGEYHSGHFWKMTFRRAWQFMALFLLPMGVILATSLITQMEFKNNTWKQLHTTPQHFTTIFFAKLAVIIALMLSFFLLFNLAICLVGVIPSAVFRGIDLPVEAFPIKHVLKLSAKFFIDSLPVIALQYLLSLQFKNFLVPVGFGLGFYVTSMIAINWKFGYLVPYTYSALVFLGQQSPINQKINLHLWAVGYFILFTIGAYLLYIFKKEKG